MDILLFAQYLGDIEDLAGNNNRFIYVAEILSQIADVEVVTSNFWHRHKRHFQSIDKGSDFLITPLAESGYKKNISAKRFYSHSQLTHHLKAYLKSRKKPDIIYCAIPALSSAKVLAEYAQEHNIKFIIDIQDLWPEAFKMVVKNQKMYQTFFYPMIKVADKIYAQADKIIAVSDSYCQRALSVNKKTSQVNGIFLGTKLKEFDNNKNTKLESSLDLDDNQLYLGYAGSLGNSYDLITVFKALKLLKRRALTVPKFIVIGTGPRLNEFKEFAQKNDINCLFTGFLAYPKMCALLVKCDIVINPIIGSSVASIINKHADYAAAGKAVINTQQSVEYQKLVDDYQMGFNCANANATDVANKLEILINDSALRAKMGANARRCAEQKFDREKTYRSIADIVLN